MLDIRGEMHSKRSIIVTNVEKQVWDKKPPETQGELLSGRIQENMTEIVITPTNSSQVIYSAPRIGRQSM